VTAASRRPRGWLLALVPLAGYGFAWVGHFVGERNRLATFTYPVCSLAGDWITLGKFVTGHLGPDLARILGSGSGRPRPTATRR